MPLSCYSSLIPFTQHATVIKAAIKQKKHVVTTSYVSPAMMDHDQAYALWSFLRAILTIILLSQCVVKGHINLITYVQHAFRAKDAGVIVFNEIGLDPGIDHLYAVKTIDEVHKEGGKVFFQFWPRHFSALI